jgi:uncharacterized membrane protein
VSEPRTLIGFFAQRHSPRVYFGLLTLLPIAVLLLLVLFAPPDGNERSQWLQFLGAFHPIAVHLPIAILVLVPLIELAGRTRFFPQLLSAVDFLLGVATCGAIAAIVLGWCLARSGSYSGSLVTQHMWGGVAVAAAAWLCWVLHARSSESRLDRGYILALVATFGLVLFTGYRGGQLSQGENHLTEHMPDRLRSLLGMQAFAAASSKSDPSTFYGARIQPVFSQHCIGCHGPSKHKANLRLDSYEAVIRGSKDGPVIKAGNAQGSELFRRVNLPPTDDDFMPSGHKPPLSSNEIKRIELWISTGASGTTPVESVKDVPGDSGGSTAAAEITFTEIDPAAVAKQRARLASAVAQLQKRFPSTLDYESRGSAGLVINVSLLGPNFGDNELSALAPVSDQIVSADFSSTAITDNSSSTIASMKRLRSLRLAHTKVTDATVKALVSLSQLESLNLFDTAISPDALTAIGQLPKLQHLYIHETKISPDTPMPEELKKKATF